jgi:hypothetical protein
VDDLDFYALAATHGTVLGIGVGATPAQVEELFGEDFLDDRQRGMFRRDYGLLEFAFYRDSFWECRAISIQIHRLLTVGGDVLPSVLRNEFGRFSSRVTIASLARAINRHGYHLTREPSGGSEHFVRMTVQESAVEIIVVGDLVTGDLNSHEPGDVWSILLPGYGNRRS